VIGPRLIQCGRCSRSLSLEVETPNSGLFKGTSSVSAALLLLPPVVRRTDTFVLVTGLNCDAVRNTIEGFGRRQYSLHFDGLH
jgi:hypothetical protein